MHRFLGLSSALLLLAGLFSGQSGSIRLSGDSPLTHPARSGPAGGTPIEDGPAWDTGGQSEGTANPDRSPSNPRSALVATVTFTDVAGAMNAAAAGYGTAVAWGDEDGDGDEDLYVVNLGPSGAGQANVLLRNDGSTFTDVTGQAGVGDSGPGVAAVWADFDNDGRLDLFVSNRPGVNALYHNQGDGTFENVGSAAGVGDPGGWGEGSAWADEDRDGLVDLYVANYSGAPSPAPNRLFHNLDGFHFSDVAAERGVAHNGNGEGIAWADFDNDGDMDLYIANAGGLNVLYQRQADGTYADVTGSMHVPGGPGSSYGAAWGDYDNDGWLDLYVAQQGGNKLYRNLGGSDFADVTDQVGGGGGSNRWSLGCAWADFDNDGDLDLHVANADISGYDPGDILFQNAGTPPYTFTDVTAAARITNTLDARGSGWADFDGDGDLDLYVVNQGAGQPNRLFENGGNDNHWLQLQLIGCTSNRAAIGARVSLVSDRLQIREVSGGSGFASQDSLPVEFGLGSWSSPVTLTVDWPSGQQLVLTGVAVDQRLALGEPCPDLTPATKTASALTVSAGAALTYTMVVPNEGGLAPRAHLSDTLPLSLTWAGRLTATWGEATWDPASHQVRWEGTISSGAILRLSYRVTVNPALPSGAVIPNRATVNDGVLPPFETAPVTVTVLSGCVAPAAVTMDYAPNAPRTGEAVTFHAAASGTAPLTFSWSFGDQTRGRFPRPRSWAGEFYTDVVTHTYSAPGSYTVTVSVDNACGEGEASAVVEIAPPTRRIYLPLILK